MKPPPCPYCGAEPILKEAEEIYGKPFGRVWVCANYPECDSLVGCHAHTSRPFGLLANKRLRSLRHKAHIVFDQSWRRHGIDRRKNAYKELGHLMGLKPHGSHIGMMDEAQCERVIEIYSQREREERENAKRRERPDSDAVL